MLWAPVTFISCRDGGKKEEEGRCLLWALEAKTPSRAGPDPALCLPGL